MYEPEETKACCWGGAECLSRVCIQLARCVFSTFLKTGSNAVTQIVQVLNSHKANLFIGKHS